VPSYTASDGIGGTYTISETYLRRQDALILGGIQAASATSAVASIVPATGRAALVEMNPLTMGQEAVITIAGPEALVGGGQAVETAEVFSAGSRAGWIQESLSAAWEAIQLALG
jgi:hypothetical protein